MYQTRSLASLLIFKKGVKFRFMANKVRFFQSLRVSALIGLVG